jgi:hypothetical protein
MWKQLSIAFAGVVVVWLPFAGLHYWRPDSSTASHTREVRIADGAQPNEQQRAFAAVPAADIQAHLSRHQVKVQAAAHGGRAGANGEYWATWVASATSGDAVALSAMTDLASSCNSLRLTHFWGFERKRGFLDRWVGATDKTKNACAELPLDYEKNLIGIALNQALQRRPLAQQDLLTLLGMTDIRLHLLHDETLLREVRRAAAMAVSDLPAYSSATMQGPTMVTMDGLFVPKHQAHARALGALAFGRSNEKTEQDLSEDVKTRLEVLRARCCDPDAKFVDLAAVGDFTVRTAVPAPEVLVPADTAVKRQAYLNVDQSTREKRIAVLRRDGLAAASQELATTVQLTRPENIHALAQLLRECSARDRKVSKARFNSDEKTAERLRVSDPLNCQKISAQTRIQALKGILKTSFTTGQTSHFLEFLSAAHATLNEYHLHKDDDLRALMLPSAKLVLNELECIPEAWATIANVFSAGVLVRRDAIERSAFVAMHATQDDRSRISDEIQSEGIEQKLSNEDSLAVSRHVEALRRKCAAGAMP